MKAKRLLANPPFPGTMAGRFSAACVRLLLLLPVLALSEAVQAQFDYTTNNGTITITHYTGPGGDVVIPSETNGLPVTSIGNGAFCGGTNLTNVTIPDSVTSVGTDAFSGCCSLTGMIIPHSVTRIGEDAFSGCSSLIEVSIGNGVIIIGETAFYKCTNLTSVTIGNRITWIHAYAFANCPELAGVYFQGDAPGFESYLFEGDSRATVYYLPGTKGWGATFGDRPTTLWRLPYPVILTFPPSFGALSNGFSFTIAWATNADVVVEACTDLTSPTWFPVATKTLTDGWTDFSDPDWTDHPACFYRLRSP